MTAALEKIVHDAQQAFSGAADIASLEKAKARFLGKTSQLTQYLKSISQLDRGARATVGAKVNNAKQQIEQALIARREALADALMRRRLAKDAIDVTLPGRGPSKGQLHPVMMTLERIEQIFSTMGFDVADGPEIETDWHNFTALNSPENHPARSMQDTFYIDTQGWRDDPLLLRTHTSAMQIRYAQIHSPPIKVIVPGRVYRVDSDATHSPMFTQLEGLYIDENIGFAALKSICIDFLFKFFESDTLQIRFRPSYFPFTEPSAEIDIKFKDTEAAKAVYSHSPDALSDQWLEVCGAGQVHPTVMRNMGLDPERYIGFAFGMGLERLAMLNYGVQDLRAFFESDLRFYPCNSQNLG